MSTGYEDLIHRIASGNAILFVGAGFSKIATNVNGDDGIPTASELANTIGELGGFDGDGDLKYAADYFLSEICTRKPELKKVLIAKLKDIFTISKPHNVHVDIMRIDWKRVYTTNYDDLIEMSARQNSRRIESRDIDASTEFFPNDRFCVHINGCIQNLNEEYINSKFKLSHSSYVAPDEFLNSNWNYIFKKDLETSSAIVFVGYSLYDIDIEKILYANPEFKQKTYFITAPLDPSKKTDKQDYILSKYGKVLKVGVEKFANAIVDNIDIINNAQQEFTTEAFDKYAISDTSPAMIKDSEIEAFLKYGQITKERIDFGMTSTQLPLYLVKRTKVESICEALATSSMICVTSELGNGKSIFLAEMAVALVLKGFNVYTLKNIAGDYITDIDKMMKSEMSFVLIIDSYSNCLDLIKYILATKPSNIKLLLSERTMNHHSIISELGGALQTRDFNIDFLEPDEISSLAKILEHTSLWGKYGQYTNTKKYEHIEFECKKQMSFVLIDILNSVQIKNEISKLLSDVFKDGIVKFNIFIICILDVMNIPITLSLISELSNSDVAISKFSNSNQLRQLFQLNHFEQSFDTKSSIYSRYLLNEHFEPQYIIEKSLLILSELDKRFVQTKSLDNIRNEVRINLFRFKFIEQMLPIKDKAGMLVNYFESIKNKLPFHLNNPQYWLQYGMAHIALKNYEKAERCLQSAYDKAKFRADYDVHKINNQKARLNLKIASLVSTNILEAMKLFIEADDLLNKHENDVYKFKIILDYKDFFDSRRNSLSQEQKKTINKASEKKLKDLDTLRSNDINNFKQEIVFADCEAQLKYILQATA